MKFYKYKQLQRLTFFGNNDLYKNDNASLSKTSEQTTSANIDNDTKLLRFDVNKISSLQLSQNARIVLESVYLPINTNIKSINITNGGSGYRSPPNVVFKGNNRTVATATATILGPIDNFTITNGGSGYKPSTFIEITGGGGTGGGSATPVITNGVITGVNITNGGAYRSPPTITINPGGSSIQSIFFASAGTGYTTNATLEITGGGGTGATAVINFVQAMGTILSSITVTNGGYGYTSNPTITVNPNGTGTGATIGTINLITASGATATSRINGSVDAINFIDDGSGYTDVPPIIEFSGGGGGTGAAATATLYTDNLDRKGPVTLRMSNLNSNSYDTHNKGYNTTLVYASNITGETFQNSSENLLYNFAINQHFFKNGYVDFIITYPNTNFILPSFETFYISFVVYDINEEELLLTNTAEVDFKNMSAHYNLNNGRIPK